MYVFVFSHVRSFIYLVSLLVKMSLSFVHSWPRVIRICTNFVSSRRLKGGLTCIYMGKVGAGLDCLKREV